MKFKLFGKSHGAITASVLALAALAMGTGDANSQVTVNVGGAGTIADSTLTTSGGTAAIGNFGDYWSAEGDAGVLKSRLVSPPIVVQNAGPVVLSFDHRYNIETGWDGGAVFVSVNGGASTYVDSSAFLSNGYTGLTDFAANGFGQSSAWSGGEYVFYGESTFYTSETLITSVANLGTFAASDVITVQFVGEWDEFFTPPGPDWEIGTFNVTDSGGSLLDVDFSIDGTSDFSVSSDSGVTNPWEYNQPTSIFEIDPDTLTADRYTPDIPGSTIDLSDTNITVQLLPGTFLVTIEAGDSFSLFDLSGGTTLTGTPDSLNLPAGTWSTTQFDSLGIITLLKPAPNTVYEPFAYSGTTLNGSGGSSEVGLLGTWTANSATGLADNLPWGALLTSGGGIGNFGAGGNTFVGSRQVDSSLVGGNGLLEDGAELWFSVIMGYDSGGNRTNTTLTFVLGDTKMSSGNFDYWVEGSGTTALGATMGRFGSNGRIVATQLRDLSFGDGKNGWVLDPNANSTAIVYPGSNANQDVQLVVGRMTWGATAGALDTIDLFLPDEDLNVDLNSPHSSLSVVVDQSGYDFIGSQRGDRVVLDEIRIGPSYASVTPTGSYWDTDGATAGAGGATPSGTWSTAVSNWSDSIDGNGGTSAWSPEGTAVFSAGDDATGAYTVTVDSTQDVNGIVAEDGSVTVSGGTALRLTSEGSVSVADGVTATFATPFTEDVAGRTLGKAGTGTAVFSGDNSGVTGGMFIGGGAAEFASAAAIAGSAEDVNIGSTGAVAFGSGFGAGNIPTALADRIVAASSGTIAVDNQLTTDFDFATPGLTGAFLGAIDDVTYTGTLTPNGTTYRLGGGGGTLTMGGTNALTGGNSLLVNTASTVVLGADNDYTGSTTVPGVTTLRILGATQTSGISLNQPSARLELGGDGAIGSGVTVNGGFGANPIISAVGNSANTGSVAMNGSVVLEGTGNVSFGVATFNGNRDITNNNTAGLFTFGGFDGTNRNVRLFGNGNTTVGDITTGSGTLRKDGSGTLTLTGTNTYTGATDLNGGTILVNGDSSAATGSISVDNCSLGGTGTVGGVVTVGGSGTLAPGTSVGTFAVTNDVTINGTFEAEIDGATADLLTINGDLSLGGSSTLELVELNAPTAPSYTLISFTGNLTGTFATTVGFSGGYSLAYPGDTGGAPGEIRLVSAATSAFNTWAASNGVPADSEAVDSDSGSLNNLGEFGLGGDPLDANDDGSLLHAFSANVAGGAEDEGILTILVRSGASFTNGAPAVSAAVDGIIYTVSADSSLPVGGSVTVTGTAAVTTGLPAAPAGYEYVSFYISGPEGYFQVTVAPE